MTKPALVSVRNFIGLFLALTLTVPSPALALRPEAKAQQTTGLEELEGALRNPSDPDRAAATVLGRQLATTLGIPAAQPAPTPTAPRAYGSQEPEAGLEEMWLPVSGSDGIAKVFSILEDIRQNIGEKHPLYGKVSIEKSPHNVKSVFLGPPERGAKIASTLGRVFLVNSEIIQGISPAGNEILLQFEGKTYAINRQGEMKEQPAAGPATEASVAPPPGLRSSQPPESTGTGLEEIDRREFLTTTAAGAAAVVVGLGSTDELLAQVPQRPTGALAPLAERLGKEREVSIVVWNPADILKLPDFFKKTVQAGVTTVWISGYDFLKKLSEQQQQAILNQAKTAGLRTLGFIDGNYDWVKQRAFVDGHYKQLTDVLLKRNLGNLRIAFATDIEPYTKPQESGWNGDLAGYTDLIETVILPKIEAFSKQRPNKVVGSLLTRFEPFWYRNGNRTDDGRQIRGLKEIPSTVIAAMTYRNSAAELVAVSSDVRIRTQGSRNEKFQVGVETLPAGEVGGAHLTFSGKEAEIPKELIDVWDALPKEDRDSLSGVFIHFKGAAQADKVLDKWLAARASAPESKKAAMPTGAVELVKGTLKRTNTLLSGQLKNAPPGARVVALIMTDNYYWQPRDGVSVAVGADGRFSVETTYSPPNRPGWLKTQEVVILVFGSSGDVTQFLSTYPKESGLRIVPDREKVKPQPVRMIRVSKDGEPEVSWNILRPILNPEGGWVVVGPDRQIALQVSPSSLEVTEIGAPPTVTAGLEEGLDHLLVLAPPGAVGMRVESAVHDWQIDSWARAMRPVQGRDSVKLTYVSAAEKAREVLQGEDRPVNGILVVAQSQGDLDLVRFALGSHLPIALLHSPELYASIRSEMLRSIGHRVVATGYADLESPTGIIDDGVARLLDPLDASLRHATGLEEAEKVLVDESIELAQARAKTYETRSATPAPVHPTASQTELRSSQLPQNIGLEETVGRRGFLAAAAAAAVTPVQHLLGAFVDGRPDQIAPDENLAVANLERGRKETFIVDLNQATSAALPPLTRIFVQKGATIPSVWNGLAPEELDEDSAKAQKQLVKLAQAGEIVLIAPSDEETALGWDQFLRTRQLLGIQTTDHLLKTLEQLAPEELPLFLASLGPAGGLILDATLREKKAGAREIVVSA